MGRTRRGRIIEHRCPSSVNVLAPSDGQTVAVTFVSPHSTLDGAPKYLETLLELLGSMWIRDVVCLQEGPFVDCLRSRGYPVRVVPTSRSSLAMLTSSWRLRRLLTARRPDVVHANGIKAAVICAVATLGTGIPVLWVKHDFSWDGWLAKVTAYGCDEIVGVSAAVVEPLGRRFTAKIHVISPGVPDFRIDRSSARRVVLEALRVDASAVLVAIVARLDPYKGHRELIEIAPAMLEHLPGLHFVVVGADADAHAHYRDALIRRAEELGVRKSFTFMGHRDDAVTIMAGSDLVVVPSVGRRGMGREGFGLVPLEALAVGTPVVAYADGALPEVLGHDAARLVPPRDRGRLAAAMIEVLTDAALRQRLTSAGSARVRERYDPARTAERMKERYRSLAFGRT